MAAWWDLRNTLVEPGAGTDNTRTQRRRCGDVSTCAYTTWSALLLLVDQDACWREGLHESSSTCQGAAALGPSLLDRSALPLLSAPTRTAMRTYLVVRSLSQAATSQQCPAGISTSLR